MNRRAATAAFVTVVGVAALAAGPPEKPHDVGLMERTGTRLAQIDVTVSGAKGGIEGLTADDFEVRIDRKLVPHFVVDDLCAPRTSAGAAEPKTGEPAPPAAGAAEEALPPKPPEATYLLYFDMAHLTQSGRRGAIDAARGMIPKLLGGGNRAMVVVSAAELKTIVPLTTEAGRLDAALVKLQDDSSAFDPFAATEESRQADVIRELERGIDFALALARRYAAEERYRQERDLRRLSMVLGRFTDVDPPKAALYFADTMRQNAGEHYLSFFAGKTLQDVNGKPVSDAAAILSGATTGSLPLDGVINEAAGLGIRFYTVEGQGMTGADSFIQTGSPNKAGAGGGGGLNQTPTGLNSQRTHDSQGTMISLAAETGGRAFLNGVSSTRMAAQIVGDMSCVYLLSFDPTDLKQDAPLAVSVAVKRPGLKATSRGRLVIQSEATRLTGRVLSAFVSPAQTGASESSLHVGLIPISYKDGKFKARIQVAVPGSAVPVSTWDIGASLVSSGIVWQDGSGRIEVQLPHTPAIYETDMDFMPGEEFDLVAVAHEVQTDTLASKELHGSWPKIDAELATVGPITVSQQIPGGFLRNGSAQTQGAVIVGEGDAVRGDAPTAVIALVCRAKDQKRPLRVVRTLIGEAETPVGTTDLDLATERCAQVVDLIPSKTLGAGTYRFVVTVSSDGRELTRAERRVLVPEKPPEGSKGAS